MLFVYFNHGFDKSIDRKVSHNIKGILAGFIFLFFGWGDWKNNEKVFTVVDNTGSSISESSGMQVLDNIIGQFEDFILQNSGEFLVLADGAQSKDKELIFALFQIVFDNVSTIEYFFV